MNPNPFTLWLPMYAPGTLPERPWWRLAKPAPRDHLGRAVDFDTYMRVDGATVCADRNPGVAMDLYDAAHPMLAPPPRAGQVWAWSDGGEDIVGKIHPEHMGGAVLFANGPYIPREEWPPPGAVLVGGPTPWGRDRPWAPVGWKP